MEKNERLKKIFLVGYRATGKTEIGRLISSLLSFRFIDLDEFIQKKEGRSIQLMVAENGWPYFRERERKALGEVMAMDEALVVACGGGAVLHEDLFSEISRRFKVVWLVASVEAIMERLFLDTKTGEQRPSLLYNRANTGFAITEEEIRETLSQREAIYRRFSHLIVDTEGMSPKDVARKVIEGLKPVVSGE